jgi:hypothetical protein
LAIAAELVHWRGVSPTRVFLVTRSIPLEPQADIAKWRRVHLLYRKLASKQKANYPITIIQNESTPEAALAQVLQGLDGTQTDRHL